METKNTNEKAEILPDEKASGVITEPKKVEKASEEAKKIASKTLFETLGVDQTGLKEFPEALKTEVRRLPQYQMLKEKLSNTPPDQLVYEAFKLMKRSSDVKHDDENIPDDGVLIRSMKQGKLECAGRVLITSTFLNDQGVKHSVANGPGHSFIISEIGEETIAYTDPNNNLYFTLPRSALKGYEGSGKTSECRIESYQPRTGEVVDGMNTPFTHFLTMSPEEGVVRQYIGNVGAALNGNEDFKKSNIPVNKEAANAVPELEKEVLGDKPVLNNFYERMEDLLATGKAQSASDKKLIVELFRSKSDKKEFSSMLASIILGDLGDRLVYLKNAPLPQRKEYSERMWEYLNSQDQEALDAISRTR